MRLFKTRGFERFARKERLTDAQLVEAIERAENGLIDADLTGGLIKQRVARAGQGKRGGYRTLIAFREGDLAVFLFGFAKNERSNIDDEELASLKELAQALLEAGVAGLETMVKKGTAKEIER